MSRGTVAIVALLLVTVAGAGPAASQRGIDEPLAVDLSESLIGISTGFTGTNVLLFGATAGVGDVIVVLRAPDNPVVVREKQRVAGIWINAASLGFAHVPGFYYLAASKPVDDLLPEETLRREGIGIRRLDFGIEPAANARERTTYTEALIRNKRRAGLFYDVPGTVAFLGARLFRSRVYLPANVPTGTYTANVLLVSDGEIVSRSQTALSVEKVGLEAQVAEFAHQQAPLYGLIAVVLALVTGWFAGFVFRKV